MELVPGCEVDLVGVITARHVIPTKTDEPFVQSQVTLDNGDEARVIWRNEDVAPSTGERVKVRGRVRSYKGMLEVRVDKWAVDRRGPPDDPIAQVVGFYADCVEAEAASSVQTSLRGSGHIELTSGPSPISGRRPLPAERKVIRWCEQREHEFGESIVAGWPMVIGTLGNRTSTDLFVSPLLVTDVQLLHEADQWVIEPVNDGVDFNPFALELLGLGREERDTYAQLVETSPEVEESQTSMERAAAILAVLEGAGMEGLAQIPPGHLVSHDGTVGIHNVGLVLASDRSTHFTKMLREDLREMLNKPDLVSDGPAAVLMGRAPAPALSLPTPHPTLFPSSLAQDQAVASAMTSSFTVVTGPPGTGKSQVLVNAIAAAVAREETVLFASKNHNAVDVVLERLLDTSRLPCILRAGRASSRPAMASSIREMLGPAGKTIESAPARRAWADVESRVRPIHDVLRKREQLKQEINQLRTDLVARTDEHPEWVELNVDVSRLAEATEETCGALDAFEGRLGLFRRWKRHRERLDRARRSLSSLGDLMGLDRSTVEFPLRSVTGKPRRTFQPRHDFSAIEGLVDTLLRVQEIREGIVGRECELNALPTDDILDDELHLIGGSRTEAGKALLNARWEEVRSNNAAARSAATTLANLLGKNGEASSGFQQARRIVLKALPAMPVWGVTNLSARTHLPLEAGLFDLVIIDEASQCDIASALPLLVRARRALVIGDERQLTHITSLGANRERAIARKWSVDDDRLSEFSYRGQSCFGLASSRVGDSPLLLNLHFRSHPAIIGFSNEHFYGKRMQLCSGRRPPDDLQAIEWVHVDGDSTAGPGERSRVNLREAEELAARVVQEAPRLLANSFSVGVISPYRAQADHVDEILVKSLGAETMKSITVATAHRYQGDERDVIFFSPVLGPSATAGQAGFAANPNLINVALTRARCRLVIVGNRDTCASLDNALGELTRYVIELESKGHSSPLELALYRALLARDITVETDLRIAGHRIGLAVQGRSRRINVECDGPAFPSEDNLHADRDRAIEADGWKVMRFNGRQLGNALTGCVDEVLRALE